jgi:hypothetical protein
MMAVINAFLLAIVIIAFVNSVDTHSVNYFTASCSVKGRCFIIGKKIMKIFILLLQIQTRY